MSPVRQRVSLRLGSASICLLAGIWSAGGAALESTGPARSDYSSFRIINDRNIFNGNRSGWGTPETREDRKPNRVEAFSLVGTMAYRKGPFAFFDGTSSEYRKVLPPGGTIASYRIAEITNSSVKLETDTNQVELKVGAQMRREEEGPWQMVEHAEAYASVGGRDDSNRGDSRGSDSRRGDSRGNDSRRGDSRGSGSFGTAATETTRSSSPAPGASSASSSKLTSEQESEILKRLMQQREQETK